MMLPTMAPGTGIKRANGDDVSRRVMDKRVVEGDERRRVADVQRRQLGSGLLFGEGKRQLNPLGGGLDFDQVAAGASRALNNFLNPTRQAAPETTTSIAAPVGGEAPESTTPPASPSTPSPAQAQPTSQLPAPVASTSQAPPVSSVPAATSSFAAVAAPIVTSKAASTTTAAPRRNPVAAAPVEIDSSSLAQKQPLADVTSLPIAQPTTVFLPSKSGVPTSRLSIPNATPTLVRGNGSAKPENGSSLAPIAQRLLIAAGVIGVVIVIIVAFLVLIRRRRGETLAMFVRRKSPKYGSRVFPPPREQPREEFYREPPPKYTTAPEPYEYAAVEKSVPSQRQMEGFYTPGPLPPLTIPARAAAVPNTYSPQGQQPEVSPLSVTGQRTQFPYQQQQARSDAFYTVSPQSAQPTSNLNQVFIQHGLYQGPSAAGYNGNFISSTDRSPVSRPYENGNYNANTYNNVLSPSTQASGGYQNTGTQNTFETIQTSNLNNPSQQESNRISTLSSLSSGFGDGLIIQDTDSIKYTNPQPQRATRQRTTRFSWQTTTSKAPGSDRTSVYTAASIESAPRFRSVNSWVAQQSGRVERQQMMAANIPAMPPVPAKLQQNVTPITHRRQESEVSAFNYHPGQEIRIAPGSRVPSSVLDKRIGHLSKSSLG